MGKQRRQKLLAHMGVQVWYQRQFESAPADTGSPEAVAMDADSESRAAPSGPGAALQALVSSHGQARVDTFSDTSADRSAGRSAERSAATSVDTSVDRSVDRSGITSGGESLAEPAAEPISQAVAPAPFAFRWLSAEGVLLLCETGTTVPSQFLRDVLGYIIWHRDHATQDTAPQTGGLEIAGDEFRWPVLQSATGSPARTLKVFFDKQLRRAPQTPAIIALTMAVHDTLSAWLPEDTGLVQLPDLAASAVQAKAKMELWKQLQNRL